jgi:hypothetical protein
MDNNHPKIKDLIDNEEKYIEELKKMPDKVLAQKLETVRIQKQWAYDQKKWIELKVLCMFEDMIITARMLRLEENPDSEEYDEPVAKPKREKKIKEKKKIKKDEQIFESNPQDDSQNNLESKSNNFTQLSLFDSGLDK